MLLVPSGHASLPGFTLDRTLVLPGFQLYAVEKWVVSRDRPYPLLVVYTADTAHTVVLDALIPSTPDDMKEAVHSMRRDARPKQTTYGTVMVTSLAHFRSDYTIVLVPEGDFRKAREQMYVNINLLRLGSAGRTALTLNHPSETTRERFCGTYLFPRELAEVKFNQTVLDLVKHTQTALGIFGFNVDRDGLLCDTTLTALQSWTSQYHPSERVPSPNVLSALFSLVFAVRNRLAAMHHLVPKDPFASPQLFSLALVNAPHHHAHSALRTPTTTPMLPMNASHITPALSDALLMMPAPTELSPGAGSIINIIGDLQVFVGALVGREKDGQSLGGIVRGIGKRSKEEDKDIGGILRALWDGNEREDKGSDDEGEDILAGLTAWNRRRVKGKLESWTGLSNRRKKVAAIVNNDDDDILSSGQVSPVNTPSVPFAAPPPIIVTRSRDPSPTQLSPITFNASVFNASASNVNLPSPSTHIPSTPNLPSTLRRRPIPTTRVTSWSIPPPREAPESSTLLRPRLSKRRSFPQYPPVQSPNILPLEHLRLDVALAGETLVLNRRQAHLANVLRATALLNARLVDTSAHLRNVYASLEHALDASESQPGTAVGGGVLGELDSERARAGKMMQSVNTLWYEAEQFSLRDAWHVAVGGRRKVVEIRGKVFGTRAGQKEDGSISAEEGAGRKRWREEGRQWRVDGKEVSVDRWGRTESEAEEERAFNRRIGKEESDVDVDDEEACVAGPSEEVAAAVKDDECAVDGQPAPIPVAWRPMWLLRFFTSWGRRTTQPQSTPAPLVQVESPKST